MHSVEKYQAGKCELYAPITVNLKENNYGVR